MKIAERKGSLIQCHCGCDQTYFKGAWRRHYSKDIMPKSLERWKNSADSSTLVRDVDDPRNFENV